MKAILKLRKRSSLTTDFKENRALLGAAFRNRKTLFLRTPGALVLPLGARDFFLGFRGVKGVVRESRERKS